MHYSDERKIMNPTKRKPDQTPDENNRVEIGPTGLAFDEWKAAGLTVPNLPRMRAQRLERLTAAIRARDYDGVLLFDPLNIRYATDTTNMQLWNTHNPFRACYVGADGYMIVWDYKNTNFLTSFNPLVREVRAGASMFYFSKGDRTEAHAERFAREIIDVVKSHGNGGKRIAVDKIAIHGLRALDKQGVNVMDGEEFMEKVRVIKNLDEIDAMRCAIHACEKSMKVMQQQAEPGMTENDVWAILHSENIKRGGEWIETRLLSSGPRTNPWFQECGPRVIEDGDILAFDTDLIGCYGICVDISRTWHIGSGEPTDEAKECYREAHLEIVENMAVLGPGVSIKEVTFGGRTVPDKYQARKYASMMHGVGLCDEWPSIKYPDAHEEGAFDATLEPGTALCVEACVGLENGNCCVKLEDQVLITEDGCENLTSYPFERIFMD